MSGTWKRSKVRLVRHRQPKGPETDRFYLNYRATSRLYRLSLENYRSESLELSHFKASRGVMSVSLVEVRRKVPVSFVSNVE